MALFMFELKSLSRIRLVMKERFRMRGTRKSRQGFFSRSLYRYRPPLCRTLDFANARFRLLRGFAILGITPSRFNVAINRHQFLLFFSNHSCKNVSTKIFEFNSARSANNFFHDINRIQRDTSSAILIRDLLLIFVLFSYLRKNL